jgi:hypothetical protein
LVKLFIDPRLAFARLKQNFGFVGKGASMLRTLIVVATIAGIIVTGGSAKATDQLPDRIIVDGSQPLALGASRKLMDPLFAEVVRFKAASQKPGTITGSHCSALWRGYLATWEVSENKLFLRGVLMGGCGDRDPAPLDQLFPGRALPIHADWFSGELTAVLPDPSADPADLLSRLKNRFLKITFEDGRVIGSSVVIPGPQYRPCPFIWCVADRLQFDANSAALTPESERLMLRWITWLKHFEGDLLTITGYADQDENDPESLSEQRARNVLRFLVAQGLDESRLTVVSNGARRNPFPGVRNEYRMVQNRQVVATPRVP